ncbi:TPA: hypothetical protein ACH3X1_000683 [Trebouxia sp. C0004]
MTVRQDLQQLQEQLRLQAHAHTASVAKSDNLQQLRDSLSAEFTQRLEAATAAQAREKAWVASQFIGFKVQLGDILSSQLADALATERPKLTLTPLRQQLLDDAVSSTSATLAESQQLMSQMTGQKETLRAETSERIASALQEHNSDVADQESWSAGKQIDAAMIAKQDQLAAAISQFENTLRSEVEARLQGSLDSLKVTMTSNADALKAHFDSELLSLRAAVTQLEGRTWQARGKPSSAAQPKAWAAGLDT